MVTLTVGAMRRRDFNQALAALAREKNLKIGQRWSLAEGMLEIASHNKTAQDVINSLVHKYAGPKARAVVEEQLTDERADEFRAEMDELLARSHEVCMDPIALGDDCTLCAADIAALLEHGIIVRSKGKAADKLRSDTDMQEAA